jgi:antitoxin (DNA-binding transcriptional repressor) of toxin-antitoxin stability system
VNRAILSLQETKTRLSRLLEKAGKGEEIMMARGKIEFRRSNLRE